MFHKDALKIAEELKALLASHCERIEIAGSVRRGKEEPHDIELVAIPKTSEALDLFGAPSGVTLSELDSVSWSLLGNPIKNGMRYKQIALNQGINLDLFIVLPPAQWGVIYTIRTGPSDFSHWIVTPKQQGGALPTNAQVKDGGVYYYGELYKMPEEIDFLKFIDLGWVEPGDRVAHWRR